MTWDESVESFTADVGGPDEDERDRAAGLVARACQVAAVGVVLAIPGALAGGLAALVFGAGDAAVWFAAGGAVGAALGCLLETDFLP